MNPIALLLLAFARRASSLTRALGSCVSIVVRHTVRAFATTVPAEMSWFLAVIAKSRCFSFWLWSSYFAVGFLVSKAEVVDRRRLRVGFDLSQCEKTCCHGGP